MATEIICFFLLGIAALLLNAGLVAQVLPLFWLILPLVIKLSFDNITESEADTIESFFVARALDNESFDFTAPGETSSRKYVCESHRKKIDFANRATISCTFREVFEP